MDSNTDILTIPDTSALRAGIAAQAVRMLLEDRRSDATKRAYKNDLIGFFQFLGASGLSAEHSDRNRRDAGATVGSDLGVTPAAVVALCELDSGSLARVLNGYAAALKGRRLSEATINRRLAAVRSLLAHARKLGMGNVDPRGLVSSEPVQAHRDTRGPDIHEAKALLAAPDRTTLRGKRDYAILLLMLDRGLRRSEVCSCRTCDFDPEHNTLSILSKGHGSQRTPVTLAANCTQAILTYLGARADSDSFGVLRSPSESFGAARNPESDRSDSSDQSAPLRIPERFRIPESGDSPLFRSLDRARKGDGALTHDGVYAIVRAYGKAALGKPLRPHALRHTAITLALDVARGDVRKVQSFSRHADVRTVMIYDDNRQDHGGKLAEAISALLEV